MSESDWEDVGASTSNDDGWEDVSYGSPAPASGNFLSMNTAENLPKSLAKGITALAGLGTALTPQAVSRGALGAAKTLYNDGSFGSAISELFGGMMQDANTIESARREYIGDPAYTSTGGRYLGAVAEQVPGMLIPGGTIAGRAASAVGAGLGGQAAIDLGAPEVVGNLIGGVAPGAITDAARSVGKALGPQSVAAADRLVGEKLSQYIDEDLFTKAVKESKDTPLGQLRTSTEIAGSPEFAIIEQQLGSGGKSLDYAAARVAREEARDAALREVFPQKGVDREIAGQEAQKLIEQARKRTKDAATAKYDAIPADTRAPIGQLRQDVETAIQQYYGAGSPSVPKRIQGGVDYINSPYDDTLDPGNGKYLMPGSPGSRPLRRDDAMTIRELQNVRSHMGDAALANPGTQEEALALAIHDKLAKAIEAAPEGSKEWRAANDAYAEFASKFMDGPLSRVSSLKPSVTVDKIMSSPESARQYLKMVGESPETLAPIKDQLAGELMGLSEAARRRFIQNNSSELKIILGDEFKTLEAVADDIASRTSAQDLANATKGSNTALKLSGVIERALTGKEAPKSGLWNSIIKGVSLGGGGAAVLASPQIAIPSILAGYGVKSLRDRSSRLVQDSLYKQISKPEELLAGIKAARSAKPPAITTKGVAGSAIMSVFKSMQDDEAPMESVFSKKEPAPMSKDVKEVEAEIDQDPYLSALYEAESSRNPKAKNPKSSASGGFQFIKSTAKSLGLDDPMDLGKSLVAIRKLTDDHKERFGEDPMLLYSAHYLGAGVLKKVLEQKPLDEEEQKQVAYLEEVALPRFQRIYESKIG